MFKLHRKIDADAAHILTLRGIIAALLLIILLLWFGWHQAPKDLIIHIPPDISSGATIKAYQVPDSAVYAFAYYVFQQVNHWSNDGGKDYQIQIKTLSPFFTPKFRQLLLDDMTNKDKIGELQNRTRSLQGLVGAAYNPTNVKPLGDGSWEVILDVMVTETVDGQTVKTTEIQYPLKIVRYDVDRERNPWGLAIDDFSHTPTRVATAI